MPAPLKEYRCEAHGPFESRAKHVLCPFGCDTVYWSPRTAPAIRTNSATRRLDQLQTNLASEFGLSDMRTKYEGESVMGNRRPEERVHTVNTSDPNQFLAQIAQGQLPSYVDKNGEVRLGGWGDATMVNGIKAPSTEDRGKITATAAPTEEQRKVYDTYRPPTHAIRHQDAKDEVEQVQELAKSE